LNFYLNQNSTVVSDESIQGIHFDLSNKNLYIASNDHQSIFIYHTNDEITFYKNGSISTSYHLFSITINNDKIYTGTNGSTVLVYNKNNFNIIQVMDSMCSGRIYSIKFDYYGDIIYSCGTPPKVKVIGSNGINLTLSFDDTYYSVHETYIDSKKRLWIGGNNGFVVYK
jgi:hypothetical protein